MKALALGLLAALVLCGCEEKAPLPREAPRAVRAFAVEPPAGSPQDAYTGYLAAHRTVNAAFRVAGKIASRAVGAGSAVARGDALAALDPVLYEDAVTAAQATLANAQAVLTQAEQSDRRTRELIASHSISVEQREAAQRALKSARAQLEGARASLHKAREELSYTTLRAEGDGVVTERLAEAGEVVPAGQPVFRIALNDGRDGLFGVPEASLAAFAVHSRVQVCSVREPSRCSAGAVEEVSPQASPASRTHTVRVHLERPEGFALGTTLAARPAAQGPRYFEIPSQCLTRSADGRDIVWRIEGGCVHSTPVAVVRHLKDTVLVSSGLSAGMRLVSAGVHVMREGEKVREVGHAAP